MTTLLELTSPTSKRVIEGEHNSLGVLSGYGPAIWTAKIEDDLVAEWRVYLETEENREMLNI